VTGCKQRFKSRSPEETQRIGEALGSRLSPGDVVACIGELGAGKTCFLQGLARGLGVREPVTSPTFVFINHYEGRIPVYHVDAYRAESLAEILDLGVEELLWGDGVTVIEWAEKLLPLLPSRTIIARISGLGDEPREIVLEGLPAEMRLLGHSAEAPPTRS
jgi:tRNA threonylcarbamoyladenosine biosynthesis protein TsaE